MECFLVLRKLLLVRLCVVVWVLFCGVFPVLRKLLLVRLCVVVWVLFCRVFLGVAETIVGWPVCYCVGIVLWSFSWCCKNHCWFTCVVVWVLFCGMFLGVAETIVGSPVLLCGYCFVECFLVL